MTWLLIALLAAIPPYVRDSFIPNGRWPDRDADCQDERAEILIAESLVPVNFVSNRRCFVSGGMWLDIYSGSVVYDARQVHIDHVVSLFDAHVSGAWRWGDARKRDFASDHRNLIPTLKQINIAKGGMAPGQFWPLNERAWCWYGVKYRTVKLTWGLKITPLQDEALDTLRRACREVGPP